MIASFKIEKYVIINYMSGTDIANIQLYDDNGYRGYVLFRSLPADGGSFTIHGNGIVNAVISHHRYPDIVDVLRNEEPVYFWGRTTDPAWASIQSGAEPTGEEEAT